MPALYEKIKRVKHYAKRYTDSKNPVEISHIPLSVLPHERDHTDASEIQYCASREVSARGAHQRGSDDVGIIGYSAR